MQAPAPSWAESACNIPPLGVPVFRVSFKTVGCRLNQAETAQIAAGFEAAGYRIVPFGEACEVCVIHTCAVTAAAEHDCARLARSAKRRHPGAKVVLAGCGVEADRDRLAARTGADVFAGQEEKFRIPELLAQAMGTRPAEEAVPFLPRIETTRAIVKVQDGCDFGCAYCIVPSLRGKPRSRPLPAVLDEVRGLADAGFIEVILTGANLGCYADGPHGIAHLLEEVETVPGIQRLRISSIEGSTAERDVIDHMASSQKLCPYLHMPLQTGDDGLLEAMGRRYRTAEYRALVEHAVSRIPRLGLGTDVVVGLPGEDESAFSNTRRLLDELPFSNVHVFSYSKRRGTAAADMDNQVADTTKKQRTTELVCLGNTKREAFARSLIGTPVSVLVERLAPDGSGRGWTRQYVRASVPPAAARVNSVVEFVPRTFDGELLR